MKKENIKKIREFIEGLPQEKREHWTNFSGGWYDFVVIKKDSLKDSLDDLINEILDNELAKS